MSEADALKQNSTLQSLNISLAPMRGPRNMIVNINNYEICRIIGGIL
jgi:hypothetical protein